MVRLLPLCALLGVVFASLPRSSATSEPPWHSATQELLKDLYPERTSTSEPPWHSATRELLKGLHPTPTPKSVVGLRPIKWPSPLPRPPIRMADHEEPALDDRAEGALGKSLEPRDLVGAGSALAGEGQGPWDIPPFLTRDGPPSATPGGTAAATMPRSLTMFATASPTSGFRGWRPRPSDRPPAAPASPPLGTQGLGKLWPISGQIRPGFKWPGIFRPAHPAQLPKTATPSFTTITTPALTTTALPGMTTPSEPDIKLSI